MRLRDLQAQMGVVSKKLPAGLRGKTPEQLEMLDDSYEGMRTGLRHARHEAGKRAAKDIAQGNVGRGTQFKNTGKTLKHAERMPKKKLMQFNRDAKEVPGYGQTMDKLTDSYGFPYKFRHID